MNRKLKNWIMAVPAGVVAVLSFAVCAGLGIASLFVLANMKTEEFAEHIPDELVITARNVPHTLAGAAVAAAALVGMCVLAVRWLSWKNARFFSILAAAGVTAFCFVWIGSFSSYPAVDQMDFWNIACFLAGRGELFDFEWEYLRLYPFQAATAMAAEPLVRLFGTSWFSWQFLSACSAGVSVYILSCICGRLTDSPAAKCLCALLTASFVPLALYSTFVYGTLPGLALALLGSYAVMRECAEAKSPVQWWALAALSFAAALILYSGEMIFLAAAVLVLFATGVFCPGQRRKILAAVLLAALAVGVSHLWQEAAMTRLGMPGESGCPILPRILMGVDAYSEKAMPGFYNGISIKVYRQCGYDAAMANRQAAMDIRNSLLALQRQGRFWQFFAEKTADQWLEPWFTSLSANNPSLYNEPRWLARALTGGVLFAPVQAWLGLLMPLVYLFGAAGILLAFAKHKTAVWRLTPMACLIGGFLFQLASEAKSRYCMPYYLCCFPMAAAGVAALAEKLLKSKGQTEKSNQMGR